MKQFVSLNERSGHKTYSIYFLITDVIQYLIKERNVDPAAGLHHLQLLQSHNNNEYSHPDE